ncbi:MAG: YopX family protein [Candidatus Omnitrophota bacterium]|jgi:uncharacterized phage protein (TIGR01671 family)
MRQYRGKRKDNGEWVYGDYLYDPDTDEHFIIEIRKKENRPSDDGCWKWHAAVPSTVGQSIGLKDRNGREGYGADRLKITHRDTGEIKYGTINWNENLVKYQLLIDSENWNMGFQCLNNCFAWEIIGSIHDESERKFWDRKPFAKKENGR